ncbi:hypothetical protein FJZ19_02300 [Candidatus Pacearchaeota archaeon]|nr:hypothetical protein [Candidatus Pacearchaeota archaeon]
MSIIRKVNEEDVGRVEALFEEAFIARPRTPCTIRALRRAMNPAILRTLELVEIAKHPEDYLPVLGEMPVKERMNFLRQGFCNGSLYSNLAEAELAQEYGHSIKGIAPGLIGYLAAYHKKKHDLGKGVLRQIRELSKDELADLLG